MEQLVNVDETSKHDTRKQGKNTTLSIYYLQFHSQCQISTIMLSVKSTVYRPTHLETYVQCNHWCRHCNKMGITYHRTKQDAAVSKAMELANCDLRHRIDQIALYRTIMIALYSDI